MKLVVAFSIALVIIIAGYSCTASRLASGSPANDGSINMDNLQANLRFLSSDELEGREAGTRGEKITARYLAAQFQQYGIKPFAYATGRHDSLSYFQEFEAVKISILPSSSLTLYDSSARKEQTYSYGDYFANFHNMLFDCSIHAPVVFAGYGITAPEFNYDDYKNIDVRGKIVIVIDGEPESDDENYFYGAIPSMYASELFYKRHRARELGAKALITLATPSLQKEWDSYIGYFKSSHMDFDLEESAGSDSSRMPFFYGSEKFLKELLSHSAYPLDSLLARAMQKRPLPAFPIKNLLAHLTVATKFGRTRAMNVVGMIEGNDPNLKKEFVAMGAHLDHLGTDYEGKIYNGADDDGSGTVAVLEVARVIAASKSNKRSILVVFHSGEEKGLLGSQYFTDEGTPRPFELSQVVAQINIDMVGRESADSIYVIGSGKLSSELKNLNEQIDRERKLFTFDYTLDAEDDPNRYYYRSDHYNYAKHGIPIVFFFDGMLTDYHKTTDDVDKINFVKIQKVGTLVFELAERIANLDHRLKVDQKDE